MSFFPPYSGGKAEKPLDLLCCELCKPHVIQQQREKFPLGPLTSLKGFNNDNIKKGMLPCF